ncbi:hypothetical protein FisN_4Hh249 [Fistulifera solaris]|uniref:START domain-containing protein n=1 Tax=Fistulifera solaris TaxID=1519565 RepID=A0A1Z5KF44_FISSO|nr:hypothetical protein FisN_4Hh249 [Fistulifera solaris]|eukprot:GAX24691.1 hypothetical protein FisN_4Hh249 [Fistulifera solaris]
MKRRSNFLLYAVTLLLSYSDASHRGPPVHHAVHTFFNNGITSGLLRSTLAVHKQLRRKVAEVQDVRLTLPTKKQLRQKLQASSLGVYYGLTPQNTRHTPSTKRTIALRDTMIETLQEIKSMRKELELLRQEIHNLKQGEAGTAPSQGDQQLSVLARRKELQREFEGVGEQVEQWAEEMLFGPDDDNWTEVQCSRVLRGAINKDGRTRAFIRWMKDSRGPRFANPKDDREYPCIKIYSTIDAPLEEVCLYLSQEQHMGDYNDLIDKYRDLQEITPSSKVCLGETPQILFIKPRQLISFCHHRWLRDGTEVVVNQACDKFEDTPATAYAFRGATYISKDPGDPERTRIALIAHANPGNDVPGWACKTAVNALAPIEPFKLFHKINTAVTNCRPQLARDLKEICQVGSGGRSSRPGGLSMLGYACFWPNGGGLCESSSNETISPPQIGAESDGPIKLGEEKERDTADSETDGQRQLVGAE